MVVSWNLGHFAGFAFSFASCFYFRCHHHVYLHALAEAFCGLRGRGPGSFGLFDFHLCQ
jgi:hypothetical protein